MSTPHHPDEPADGSTDADAARPGPTSSTPAADPAATPPTSPADPRAGDAGSDGVDDGDGDDLDARFLAIVSGIAPSMQWHPAEGTSRLEQRAAERAGERPEETASDDGSSDPWPAGRARTQDPRPSGDLLDRPAGPVPPAVPPTMPAVPPAGRAPGDRVDTADERSRRRAARRQERAEELAAFNAEKAEREREYAEDDAHYEPPPPPPLPRPRGRTVAAVLALAAGVVLLARPTLLELNQDVSIVLAVLIILAGLGGLVAGLRRPAPDGSDGWDDGARL